MPYFPHKTSILRALYAVSFFVFAESAMARTESSDRFGVIGVIAQKSSPQSKQSLAVIRDSQTNKNLVVRVGDKIPGGFSIKSIRQGEVRITADGKDFILSPKSFDGVSAIASSETSRDPVELDDSDIEEEFIEPPPPGSPPGTPGERYTMSPGEVREPVRKAGDGDFPTTRRPLMPPPPIRDEFGRSSDGYPEPPPPPTLPSRDSEFDDSFSGYEDLFEGP